MRRIPQAARYDEPMTRDKTSNQAMQPTPRPTVMSASRTSGSQFPPAVSTLQLNVDDFYATKRAKMQSGTDRKTVISNLEAYLQLIILDRG